MKAEPADALVKPVTVEELGKRTLVEIVNAETRQVLAQLHRGESAHIGAGMPVPGIELMHFYDTAKLNTVSHVHGTIEFMNNGNVVYSDNSLRGSVVERRSQNPLSMGLPVPVLFFQMLHNTVSAYLVRNAVSRDAEPRNLPAHLVPPNGVRLKHNDNLLLGFVYGLAVPSRAARVIAGGSHTLQPPAAIVHDGQIMAPKLAVYIR